MAALTAAMSGCQANDSSTSTAHSGQTSLKISVVAEPGATPVVVELTCDPPGGTHPRPVRACAALAAAGAASLDRPRPQAACHLIYGGPETATVTGRYLGSKVDVSFGRADGCSLARWDALGTDFFGVP